MGTLNGKLVFSTILLFLISASSHARVSKLENPTPIEIANKLSIEKLDEIVFGSISQAGWIKEIVISESPRTVEASFHARSHRILVRIVYDSTHIATEYIDSENMQFKSRGTELYIHPSYLKWSQQLADTLRRNSLKGESFVFDEVQTKNAKRWTNAAPSEAFSNFTKFELKQTILSEAHRGHEINLEVRDNVDYGLSQSLVTTLSNWNSDTQPSRTLIIQPYIKGVRFIGNAARFWAGGKAGKSWIYV